jgi:hypothetical protein
MEINKYIEKRNDRRYWFMKKKKMIRKNREEF